MAGGIVAQYGFLYQKYSYILIALKNIATDNYFTYEGKDDIDIEKEDSLYSVSVSKKSYIQVKSGIINENCMIRIIGNWMNMDEFSANPNFILYAENQLSFNYKTIDFSKKIIESFRTGATKKRGSILRTAYDKYSLELDSPLFESKVLDLLNAIDLKVKSFDQISEDIFSTFKSFYCTDIMVYELAKNKRIERFISYISEAIDESISRKAPFVLQYSQFIGFIQKVSQEITDQKYNIDVYTTKKKMREEAKKIVSKQSSRDVQQLCLVKDQEEFVIEGIIQELLYKDFRDIYINSIDISNIEQEAKENYDETVLGLDNINKTPLNIYSSTTKKQIENHLLPSGSIYRKGCYIFMTRDDIQCDLQITWGDSDAE